MNLVNDSFKSVLLNSSTQQFNRLSGNNIGSMQTKQISELSNKSKSTESNVDKDMDPHKENKHMKYNRSKDKNQHQEFFGRKSRVA